MAYVVARAITTLASWFSFLSRSTVARRFQAVWWVALRCLERERERERPVYNNIVSLSFLLLFFLPFSFYLCLSVRPLVVFYLTLLSDALPSAGSKRRKERKKTTWKIFVWRVLSSSRRLMDTQRTKRLFTCVRTYERSLLDTTAVSHVRDIHIEKLRVAGMRAYVHAYVRRFSVQRAHG